MKVLVLLFVIVVSGLIEVIVDKALGVDFSGLSTSKVIAHNLLYKFSGAAICAYILLL